MFQYMCLEHLQLGIERLEVGRHTALLSLTLLAENGRIRYRIKRPDIGCSTYGRMPFVYIPC